MLKIRLTRTGKRHQPHYRIIVAEAKSKRDGKYLDNLGYYIPYTNPATLKLNLDSYQEWINKGAQPTEVVRNLRTKTKSNDEITIAKTKTKKKKKDKQAKQE